MLCIISLILFPGGDLRLPFLTCLLSHHAGLAMLAIRICAVKHRFRPMHCVHLFAGFEIQLLSGSSRICSILLAVQIEPQGEISSGELLACWNTLFAITQGNCTCIRLCQQQGL